MCFPSVHFKVQMPCHHTHTLAGGPARAAARDTGMAMRSSYTSARTYTSHTKRGTQRHRKENVTTLGR